MSNEVYTVSDIQNILNISRNAAYNLIESPPFPVKRIGSAIRIPREPFERWLNADESISEAREA